jgi:hypothetical protein
VIENRTAGAIRAGGMTTGRICLHAASGMTEREYRWAEWRLHRHGVRAPRPEALIRRAIVGVIDVLDIIEHSDSEWFGGPCGLVIENPLAIDPIPATGALGYFNWVAGGVLALPAPWMARYARPSGDAATLPLFDDLPPDPRETLQRPGRRK